ncbi:Hypothetical predicted protein [Pelobates cultripes]|uniref:Uncharacterized protein n=1 Tax=Pelobates cultripes TaxID=61616 RepID=A0AAD1SVZ7_PELCU|nr:Hypothetical predicted protein [Pelobates cultripes]
MVLLKRYFLLAACHWSDSAAHQWFKGIFANLRSYWSVLFWTAGFCSVNRKKLLPEANSRALWIRCNWINRRVMMKLPSAPE